MRSAALAFVVAATAAVTASGGKAPPRSTWRASARAYVRGLARAPKRLLERVDPGRGLVVVRSLSCETERPRETSTRACGADIERAAAPVLDALGALLRLNARIGDGPGVRCTEHPRAACRVPPTSECEPEITIVFAAPADDAAVIAIIERDDWQSQPFYRAATNRRIEALLAGPSAGCR